jgi:hypothetical protein
MDGVDRIRCSRSTPSAAITAPVAATIAHIINKGLSIVTAFKVL